MLGPCPTHPGSAVPLFQGNWSWKKSDNVDVSLSSSISGFGLVGQARKSETDIKRQIVLFYIYFTWFNSVHIFVQQLKLYAFTFEFLLLYALFSLFWIVCCFNFLLWVVCHLVPKVCYYKNISFFLKFLLSYYDIVSCGVLTFFVEKSANEINIIDKW